MKSNEKMTLPKGNDTCCHICYLCENPCNLKNLCTGACGGCPHPCWADLSEIEARIKKHRRQKNANSKV